MSVQKIPAFVSLLVPTQMDLMFAAALLVMCYDLIKERVQVS